MILIGKAKEDFLKYYGTGENYFTTTISEIEQYANIIDWLDSVGLFCVSNYNFINANWSYSVKNIDTILLRGCNYINRQEATKQAIIKANEIYNEMSKL